MTHPTARRPTAAASSAAMAYNASRGHLSPATPAAPRPRKRGRSPHAAVWSASSDYVASFDRRRWQNPAGAPPRAWHEFCVPSRRWVVAEEASTSSRDACTIMSYNILADTHARNNPQLYWGVSWDAMRWDLRRRLILREIRHWDSDLVCLQEVDRFREIAPEMKNRGYECSFKGRTWDARDGCATFWKTERLHLLEEDSIDFNEFNLWNNVAQIFVFELNGTQKFVLGNIHVLFNPKRGDVKLGQIRILLEMANALAEKWGGIPIVLAGDFNCTPDSAIYKFLSTMKLNISLHDRRQLSGRLDSSEFDSCEHDRSPKYRWSAAEVRSATGYSNVMVARHPLKLYSSYAMLKGNTSNRGDHGEPLATSYHKKFLGTVDYLWYTPGLECSRVLDTVALRDLRKTRGLPTREMGSDHLPLVAEFVFTGLTQDDSEQEDESEEESESEEEDESEQDDESAQEMTKAKHIYFSSDSDS